MKKIKLLLVLFSAIMFFTSCASHCNLKPQIMTLTLPSDDVPIASINITKPPYNAKNNGSNNVTKIFQKAIDDAAFNGGAVIFVPAGHYRFDGTLTLRETVILRGEWINPEENNCKTEGTVFDIYSGRGNDKTNAPPFLSLERGSGVKNLSFWYPEQTIQQSNFSTIPYPWTVKCNTADKNGNNTAIINVTFVNSYKAIKIGPEWNELHYIKNVYGTPLKSGIEMDFTTDIGRIYNLHFAPKYWAKSKLKNAPKEKIIRKFLRENAIAVTIGRSDWEYMYDTFIDSYNIAVRIIKSDHGKPNGAICNLFVSDANIGILIDAADKSGYLVANSKINVTGTNSYCVYIDKELNSAILFNTCEFGGNPSKIIYGGGEDSHLSFQNCTFKDKKNKNADIEIKGGTIAVIDSVFEGKALHFNLGKKVICAQILDNKYPGNKPLINNVSTGQVFISQTPLHCKKLKFKNYVYHKTPKPNSTNIFIATNFGAKKDGKTDDTKAIQSVLDTAGKNGGGTVYLPAGYYKISSHLTIPSGVELRGIWDVPHHTTSHGSVLEAYEGRGDENARPFIEIETGAGIRGLTVWYPEQSDEKFFPYPWTIRTLGKNCWIKDVALGNPYKGADLASYESAGHYVDYLCGAPLKTGIYISKNSGDGWVESLHFNPHYWARNPNYSQPDAPDIRTIWEYQKTNLVAFKFGYCENEYNLGLFVYSALKGMYFVDDNGGCNSDIILPGIDAVSSAIVLEKTGKKGLNFIANQLVVTGGKIDSVIKAENNFTGTANIFSTIVWGDGKGIAAKINGKGKITIQQYYSRVGDFYINSGKSYLRNIILAPHRNQKPKFVFGEHIKKADLIAVYSKEGTIIENNAGNKLTEKYNYKQ